MKCNLYGVGGSSNLMGKKLENWGRYCVLKCWVIQARFMGSCINGLSFKIGYKGFFKATYTFFSLPRL